jgi:hypothetical protein
MSTRHTQTRNAGLRQEKREEGDKRNVAWRALSPAAQVKELDQRLGVGVGAKRQRTKLAATLTPVPVVLSPEAAAGYEPVRPTTFHSKSEERRMKFMRPHVSTRGQKS